MKTISRQVTWRWKLLGQYKYAITKTVNGYIPTIEFAGPLMDAPVFDTWVKAAEYILASKASYSGMAMHKMGAKYSYGTAGSGKSVFVRSHQTGLAPRYKGNIRP